MKTGTSTKNRACTGKRSYPTRAKAESTMRRLVKNGASEDGLNVYSCRFCSGFHVGHLGPKEQRRR